MYFEKSVSNRDPSSLKTFGQGLLDRAIQLEPRARSIKKVAAGLGVELTPGRLFYLTKLAKERDGEFYSNGLRVSTPIGPRPRAISDMDFTPTNREGGTALSPEPREATKFLLTFFVEMQNYALLVDAGERKRPDILRGETNKNTAQVATHLGFSMVDYEFTHGVWAPFPVVRDTVFSERTNAHIEMLSQRFATMQPPAPLA